MRPIRWEEYSESDLGVLDYRCSRTPPPESARLMLQADIFTLFSHYISVGMRAAGMPRSRDSPWGPVGPRDYWDMIHNPSIPLEKRREMFAPYLKRMRYGSYARPAFIAAREIYGFDDVSEENYRMVFKRIATENRPGIYHRILREKCRSARAQGCAYSENRTGYDLNLLIPLMPLDTYASVRSRRTVDEHA